MNTKLTLRIDDALIDKARRFSAESGKSISQLVAEYFALLESSRVGPEPTPRVQRMIGLLREDPEQSADEVYAAHLLEKHS